MCGWMGGQKHGWVKVWVNGWTDECVAKHVGEWMDR